MSEPSTFAMNVLRKTYLQPGENWGDAVHRVVCHVVPQKKDPSERVDTLREQLWEVIYRREFIPNMVFFMNAGTQRGNLNACFSIEIGDTLEEIFEAQRRFGVVLSVGGGAGFNFSALRPKGSALRAGGSASGPVEFMKVFDAVGGVMKAGGRRRGGAIGVLSVYHKDVKEFISSKASGGIENFNISVLVDNKFMRAVENGSKVEKEVFDLAVAHAWKRAEPGLLFDEALNRDNPAPSWGKVVTTNPCGEITLPGVFSCNLGSIDVSRFVSDNREVDWERLAKVIRLGVTFLDRALDVTVYPFEDLGDRMRELRPIGLGIMGFAEYLLKQGIRYGSEASVEAAHDLGCFFRQEAEMVSEELGKELGFCTWEKRGDRRKRRNSSLLAIAPTGTLALVAGCTGSVEPVFAWRTKRQVVTHGEEEVLTHPLYEKAVSRLRPGEKLPDCFVTAYEVSPSEHVAVQAAFQAHVDGGVSKTVNLPAKATKRDVEEVFMQAWKKGCKGVTVYREGCFETQVLTKVEGSLRRPRGLQGKTTRIKVGCGTLWVTLNEIEGKLYETFVRSGKGGGCSAQSEALGRLVSLALQEGVPVDRLVEQLRGIKCSACIAGGRAEALSCPDALGRLLVGAPLRELKENGEPVASSRLCPECGAIVTPVGGCWYCYSCGWTECS